MHGVCQAGLCLMGSESGEDARRTVCASRFVAVAESLRGDSEVLAAIPHLSGNEYKS